MSSAADPRRLAIGVLAALFATIVWGGWFPISRQAVTSSLTPGDIALLRFVVAGTILVPVVFRHGLKAGRAGWWGAIGLFLTVGAPYPYLLAVGLEFAPASHVAIFVPGVFPSLTFLAGVVLFRDAIGRRQLLGLSLTIVAVALIAWTVLEVEGIGRLQGYLIFLLCALMWTGFTLIVRYAEIGAIHATAIIGVLSMLIYLPPYLVWGESRLPELPLGQLLFQLTYHGLLGGFLSMFFYSFSVNVLGAGRAAIFGSLVPCFAAILAVPILGESIGWREIWAIVAAVAGIALVTGARLPGGTARR